jgi:protein-disulfide isomerase
VNQKSGVLLVISALILGASIVAGSLLIKGSLDGVAEQISEARVALPEAKPAPRPTAAARPGRPDPSKRYTVKTAGSAARGPEKAKVTLVEFSDFQCPYCARVTSTLEQIEKEYGDEVRRVFKHLPLGFHKKAPGAHAAAEAAHRQGKFWEMHGAIFGNQRQMSPEQYVEYAKEIGLDMEKFTADVASQSVKSRVDEDTREAARLGVTGTPGFFINGRFLSGAKPIQEFKKLIDEELGRD